MIAKGPLFSGLFVVCNNVWFDALPELVERMACLSHA
jgi:hypothetical protein